MTRLLLAGLVGVALWRVLRRPPAVPDETAVVGLADGTESRLAAADPTGAALLAIAGEVA